MKIDKFKFFTGITNSRINWQLTGLLDDATNVPLLIGVLDITHKYLVDNNLMDKSIVLIIMTKLYRDKYNSYSDYDIRGKIDEVMHTMNTPHTRRMVQEIRFNSFMTVDIEAETNHIIYEQCKWEEHDFGF
jgi:hypothetical protein